MSQLITGVPRDWPTELLTPTADDGGPEWVAADESGTTGANLLDQQTIIAHATVRIDDLTAEPVLADLRGRAGAIQAPEVRFSQFQRRRAARALATAFGADGPLAGRVNIVVADKRYFAVGKIIDLLLEEWAHAHGIDLYEDGSARRMARTFFREGPRALGEQWEPLIVAFVSLVRATQRQGTKEDVPSFYRRLEAAQRRCHRRSVEPVLSMLLETRPYAEKLVARASRGDGLSSVELDPLGALIPDSIRYWYAICHGPFRLLHDEHALLQPKFVQDMLSGIWNLHPSFIGRVPRARVALFATGTSSTHPSIQLADLAAGAGRVVVAAHLGQPNEVSAVLAPTVAPLITWGLLPDDSFWEGH